MLPERSIKCVDLTRLHQRFVVFGFGAGPFNHMLWVNACNYPSTIASLHWINPEEYKWTDHVISQRSANVNTLRWRHDGRDGVSNHQPHDCLLNCLFRRRSKKTSKLRVTGLCVGNSPGTGEFPAQMASNAENVSIWWRHHDINTKPCAYYIVHTVLAFICACMPGASFTTSY